MWPSGLSFSIQRVRCAMECHRCGIVVEVEYRDYIEIDRQIRCVDCAKIIDQLNYENDELLNDLRNDVNLDW